MRVTHVTRLVNNQTIEALRKTIISSVAEAPQYINTVKEEQKKIVYDKLRDLNRWYTRIIGLDEVKVYQDRVTSLQEQLLKTQEKRRQIGRQLAEVRQKSIELQDQIQKVKRQDEFDKFLELMRQETEILKLEKSISLTFQDYDQTERDLFTAFSNAIRDSHEKQRAQLEYTKYFGLVLSIAGSFLAFVYTTVKKHDLKVFIEEKLSGINANNEPVILNLIQANEKTADELIKNREKLNEVVKVLTLEQASLKGTEDLQVIKWDPTEKSNSTYVKAIGVMNIIICAYLLFKSLGY